MASESFFVFVSTNIDTHLGLVFEANETVLGFKDKFCIEHKRCFENVGEIKISAVKIKWGTDYFLLPDSMIVKKAFDRSIGSKDLFLFLDVFPVVVVDNASEVLKVSKMKKDITFPNEKEGVQVFAQGPAAMNKDDFVSDVIDGALNTEIDFGTKVKAVGEEVEAIENATEISLKEDVVREDVEAMQTGVAKCAFVCQATAGASQIGSDIGTEKKAVREEVEAIETGIGTDTSGKGVGDGVEPMQIETEAVARGEAVGGEVDAMTIGAQIDENQKSVWEDVETVQTVTVIDTNVKAVGEEGDFVVKPRKKRSKKKKAKTATEDAVQVPSERSDGECGQ